LQRLFDPNSHREFPYPKHSISRGTAVRRPGPLRYPEQEVPV
jgi:hypothetical protein